MDIDTFVWCGGWMNPGIIQWDPFVWGIKVDANVWSFEGFPL